MEQVFCPRKCPQRSAASSQGWWLLGFRRAGCGTAYPASSASSRLSMGSVDRSWFLRICERMAS